MNTGPRRAGPYEFPIELGTVTISRASVERAAPEMFLMLHELQRHWVRGEKVCIMCGEPQPDDYEPQRHRPDCRLDGLLRKVSGT